MKKIIPLVVVTSCIAFAQTAYAATKKEVLNHYSDIALATYGDSLLTAKKLQQSLEKLGFKLWNYGADSIMGSETLGQVSALFKFLKKSEF